jgi:hypothetical protein
MELETKVFRVILDLRVFRVCKETRELVDSLVVKVFKVSRAFKVFKVQKLGLEQSPLELFFGLQKTLLQVDIWSVTDLLFLEDFIMFSLLLLEQPGVRETE